MANGITSLLPTYTLIFDLTMARNCSIYFIQFAGWTEENPTDFSMHSIKRYWYICSAFYCSLTAGTSNCIWLNAAATRPTIFSLASSFFSEEWGTGGCQQGHPQGEFGLIHRFSQYMANFTPFLLYTHLVQYSDWQSGVQMVEHYKLALH